jgi:flagellar protein FlaI
MRFSLDVVKAIRHGDAEKPGRPVSRMSFEVLEPGGGECIEKLGMGIDSAVVKSPGPMSPYAYAIGYQFRVSSSDLRTMEAAKSAVIDSLCTTSSDIGLGLFAQARSIARDELARRADPARAECLSYFVAHDTVGYGPISILLEDRKNIEEIEINAPSLPISVYTTRFGRCQTNLRFAGEDAFRYSINRYVSAGEKELSEETPIIDVQVSDARVHAQIKPYVLSGAAASIRLGGEKRAGLGFLLKAGTLSPDALAYLWLAADSGLNAVIAGAPASGKTTLLASIAELIPPHYRIITIEEDINELRFGGAFANVIALYGEKLKVTTKEQVLNALRLRPDRIVIGEIRGDEARDLFSGASMGIPFMTTMHSSSEDLGVIKRLMIRPMSVETRSISMLDLSLHMLQVDTRRRMLSTAYEYRWLSRAEAEEGLEIGDGDMVSVSKVIEGGELAKSALADSKAVACFGKRHGLSKRRSIQELEKRAAFLSEIASGKTQAGGMGSLASQYAGRVA